MGSRPSNLGAAADTADAAQTGAPANAPSTRADVEARARRTGGQWAIRRAQSYAAGLPEQPTTPPFPGRRGSAVTPSTFTPASGSRALSSLASPDVDSGNNSEAACSDGFDAGRPVSTEGRLLQARQHADDSLEALRMELKGFGGAVAVRYASWPAGAAVEVMCAVGSTASSAGVGDSQFEISNGGSVPARLVRYLAGENSFEVRLRDGSTRVVPAQRVRRVSNVVRQPPRPARPLTPELLS
mmetsp:Transcript_88575/g.258911  ORF Transcript_88575/g.258911 Transcript_88575/m.258911 type:complete len:242 (-) Transcript_88575:48-773(-)